MGQGVNSMIQYFQDIFSKFGDWLLTVLPTSPFQGFLSNFHNKFDTGLGWLNWIISFRDIRTIFLVWLGAVALFYLYSIIMRWIKMI